MNTSQAKQWSTGRMLICTWVVLNMQPDICSMRGSGINSFLTWDMVVKDEPFAKLINQGMIQGRSNFVYRLAGTNKYISYNLAREYMKEYQSK
jgi:hypothetical protein